MVNVELCVTCVFAVQSIVCCIISRVCVLWLRGVGGVNGFPVAAQTLRIKFKFTFASPVCFVSLSRFPETAAMIKQMACRSEPRKDEITQPIITMTLIPYFLSTCAVFPSPPPMPTRTSGWHLPSQGVGSPGIAALPPSRGELSRGPRPRHLEVPGIWPGTAMSV